MAKINAVKLYDSDRILVGDPGGVSILSCVKGNILRSQKMGEAESLSITFNAWTAAATTIEADGKMAMRRRRIIRLEYDDASFREYRIREFTRDVSGDADAVLRGVHLPNEELRRLHPKQHLTGGFTLVQMRLIGLSPQVALDGLFGATWNGPSLIKAGTVNGSITVSEVNLFTDGTQSFADVLKDLAVQCEGEVELNYHSGSDKYVVDIYPQIGLTSGERSGGIEPENRPIEIGDLTGVLSANNRMKNRRRSDSRSYFSRIMPLGGGADDTVTIGAAEWTVNSGSFNVGSGYTKLTLSDDPVYLDEGQTGEYFGNGSEGFALITKSTSPDLVYVSGNETGIVGQKGLFADNSGGDELVHMNNPAALDGIFEKVQRFSNVGPFKNHVPNADISDWSAGLPVSWSKIVGPETVTENTDARYTQVGTKSAKIVCGTDEGLQVGITVDADSNSYWSCWVYLRVTAGGVKLEFHDFDGIIEPVEGEAGSTDNNLLAIVIQGLEPAKGAGALKVIATEPGTTFYLDAATMTNSTAAYEFVPHMGPTGLWHETARFIREKDEYEDAYETSFLDVSFNNGSLHEVDIGSWVRVKDVPNQGSASHDIQFDARVIEIRSEEDHHTGAFKKAVKVSRRTRNFTDRFRERLPQYPGAFQVGADISPSNNLDVEWLAFQRGSGSDEYGYLRGIPGYIGEVLDVEFRSAEGANVLFADSWGNVTYNAASGWYQQGVKLHARRDSELQMRFNWVDTTKKSNFVAHLFDHDLLPEPPFVLDWWWNTGSDLWELFASITQDEDSLSTQIYLDADAAGSQIVNLDSYLKRVNLSRLMAPDVTWSAGSSDVGVDVSVKGWSETGATGIEGTYKQISTNVPREIVTGSATFLEYENFQYDNAGSMTGRVELRPVPYAQTDMGSAFFRFAQGSHVATADAWTVLAWEAEGVGTGWTAEGVLDNIRQSHLQTRVLWADGSRAEEKRDFILDPDRVPEPKFTLDWYWNDANDEWEIRAWVIRDEDSKSVQIYINTDAVGSKVVNLTDYLEEVNISTLMAPDRVWSAGSEFDQVDVNVKGWSGLSATGIEGAYKELTTTVPPALSVEKQPEGEPFKVTPSSLDYQPFQYDNSGSETGRVEIRPVPYSVSNTFQNDPEDFTTWTAENASVTADAAVAPDGTLTADKLKENGAVSAHDIFQQRTINSGSQYTISVFAKAAERSLLRVYLGDGGFPAACGVWFDLLSGTVGSEGSSIDSSGITYVGNGWYRCWATDTADASGTNYAALFVCLEDGLTVYDGDGSSGLYLWGAQFEEAPLSDYSKANVGSVFFRFAQGAQVGSGAAWSELTYEAEGAGTGWTAEGVLHETRNSHLQTKVQWLDADRADEINDFTIDPDLIPEPPFTLQWKWDSAQNEWEIHATVTRDDDSLSGKAYITSSATGSVLFTMDDHINEINVSVLMAPDRAWPSGSEGTVATVGIRGYSGLAGAGTAGPWAELTAAIPQKAGVQSEGAAVSVPPTTLDYQNFQYDDGGTNTGRVEILPVPYSVVNLHLSPEAFDDAAWVKTRVDIAANDFVAPNGTLTADRMTPQNTAGGTYYMYDGIPVTSGQDATFSIYVRAAGYQWIYMSFSGTGGAFADDKVWFDLLSGTIGTIDADITASIEHVGDGWYRIVATREALATTSGTIVYLASEADGDTSHSPDGIAGYHFWGAQGEIASAATEYNKTQTGSAFFRYAGGAQVGSGTAWTELVWEAEGGGTGWTAEGILHEVRNSHIQTLVQFVDANRADEFKDFTIDPDLIPEPTFTLYWVWVVPGATYAQGQWEIHALITRDDDSLSGKIYMGSPAGGSVVFNMANLLTDLNASVLMVPDEVYTAGSEGVVVTVGVKGYSETAAGGIAGVWNEVTAVVPPKSTAIQPDARSFAESLQTLDYQPFQYDDGGNETGRVEVRPVPYDPANLYLKSEELDDAYWNKTECTIDANATTAPNGKLVADQLVESVTASTAHYVHRALTVSSGLPYTFSFYAKAAGRAWMRIAIPSGTSVFEPSILFWFNLETGEFGTVAGDVEDHGAEYVGNGWYRMWVMATSIGAGSVNPTVLMGELNGQNNYTGDGVSGAYVWGIQAEQALSPTPHSQINYGSAFFRFAQGAQVGSGLAWTELTWEAEGAGTGWTAEGVLHETRNSHIQTRVQWLDADRADEIVDFTIDPDLIPEPPFTLSWEWNTGSDLWEIHAIVTRDDDSLSGAHYLSPGVGSDQFEMTDYVNDVNLSRTATPVHTYPAGSANTAVTVGIRGYSEASGGGLTGAYKELVTNVPQETPVATLDTQIQYTPWQEDRGGGEGGYLRIRRVPVGSAGISNVRYKIKSGGNIGDAQAFETDPTFDGGGAGSGWLMAVALHPERNSQVETHVLWTDGSRATDVRLWSFDHDRNPLPKATTEWVWSTGSGKWDLYMIIVRDEDSLSWEADLTGATGSVWSNFVASISRINLSSATWAGDNRRWNPGSAGTPATIGIKGWSAAGATGSAGTRFTLSTVVPELKESDHIQNSAIGSAKIQTGAVVAGKISDEAVDWAQLKSTISPIFVAAALPGVGSGYAVVYLTANDGSNDALHLYRNTGAAWQIVRAEVLADRVIAATLSAIVGSMGALLIDNKISVDANGYITMGGHTGNGSIITGVQVGYLNRDLSITDYGLAAAISGAEVIRLTAGEGLVYQAGGAGVYRTTWENASGETTAAIAGLTTQAGLYMYAQAGSGDDPMRVSLNSVSEDSFGQCALDVHADDHFTTGNTHDPFTSIYGIPGTARLHVGLAGVGTNRPKATGSTGVLWVNGDFRLDTTVAASKTATGSYLKVIVGTRTDYFLQLYK